MINNRHSNEHLRVVVLQTILKSKPRLRRLIVQAYADGTVYLKGVVPNRREGDAIAALARSVTGVTHVFCNLTTEA
jgi:hypothetical protein